MNDRICNLKIHSSTRDSPALRMGISQMLGAVQLRPAGMAPSAILFVDKLVETLPKGAATLHPSVEGKRRWQSVIKDRIEVLYQKATRPCEGRVGGSAKAIVFTDKAELIACLCRDILEGNAHTKWWWQRSYADKFLVNNLSKALTSCLADDAKLLPMVMDLLAKWDQAINLVSALDNDDATCLIEAVLCEYSCSRLHDKISRPLIVEELQDTQNGFKKPSSTDDGLSNVKTARVRYLSEGNSVKNGTNAYLSPYSRRSRSTGVVPPWFTMFDRQAWDSNLTKQQACLLGICRLACSKSAILRNQIFEDQIAHWWLEYDKVNPQEKSSDDGQSTGIEMGDLANDFIENGEISHGEEVVRKSQNIKPDEHFLLESHEKNGSMAFPPRPNKKIVNENESHETSVDDVFDVADESADSNMAGLSSEGFAEADVDISSNSSDLGSSTDIHRKAKAGRTPIEGKVGNSSDGESRDDTHDLDEDHDTEAWFKEDHFDTRLGGCLYLINLLCQLELPECMGEDWSLDRYLSPWALLEIVTRSLMADAGKPYEKDPYWDMLANLDNRRSDEPGYEKQLGKKLSVNPDYYLPVECWEYLIHHKSFEENPDDIARQDEKVFWSIANDRLRIWSNNCILVERCVAHTVQMQNTHPLDEGELFKFAQEKIVKKHLRPYLKNTASIELVNASFDDAPYESFDDVNARYIAPALRRWASLILPFLRRYLQTQLLLNGATADELVETLLVLPARIYTTSTHIDLVGDINSSSLKIRCSGLDQDPGWLPLYGRVVLFHFS